MRNFIYFIGGTGTRIESVFLHLCAMGFVKDPTTVITMDMDDQNGNTTRATRLLNAMKKFTMPDYLEPSQHSPGEKQKTFCQVPIDAYEWSFSTRFIQFADGGGDGTNRSALTQKTFRDAYGRNTDPDLVDAFFTDGQQDMKLECGFQGNPCIGAALFSSIVKQKNSADPVQPIRAFHASNPNEHIRVFIVGSIFGGTGASCFSNLARYIHDETAEFALTEGGRKISLVHVAGTLVLPYFGFPADPKRTTTDPDKFNSESRVALKYYHDMTDLLIGTDAQNRPEGILEALYLTGSGVKHRTPYPKLSNGKEDQINHFDLIDLIGAWFAVDFFRKMPAGPYLGLCNAGSKKERIRAYGTDNKTEFSIEQLPPDLRDGLYKMLRFSIFLICKVRPDLEGASDRNYGSMLNDLYGSGNIAQWNDTQLRAKQVVHEFFAYCREFVEFAHDLAHNGADWLETNDPTADDHDFYRFFNVTLLDQLYRCVEGTDPQPTIRELNDMQAEKEYTTSRHRNLFKKGVASAQSIFDKLSGRGGIFEGAYKKAGYTQQDTVEMRICDYLHTAFKYSEESGGKK